MAVLNCFSYETENGRSLKRYIRCYILYASVDNMRTHIHTHMYVRTSTNTHRFLYLCLNGCCSFSSSYSQLAVPVGCQQYSWHSTVLSLLPVLPLSVHKCKSGYLTSVAVAHMFNLKSIIQFLHTVSL